jgi:hypothetical protein
MKREILNGEKEKEEQGPARYPVNFAAASGSVSHERDQ